ncbi:MAG: hypothetical protein II370_02780, partial [Clostridia bacterium]|nr:hypothetical protein [Clostridia bacterium]
MTPCAYSSTDSATSAPLSTSTKTHRPESVPKSRPITYFFIDITPFYLITRHRGGLIEGDGIPTDAYAVKTIVSTELAAAICKANGVKLYNVLTGFKFIGEVIKNHEADGHGTFMFGFEESYGYLKGTYARDKDAVCAAMLAVEMAAYYKAKNMTLYDALQSIYVKYGYYGEKALDVYMEGLDGIERRANTMKNLRENAPK